MVGPNGAWMQTPEGDRVDLSSRQSLRRILLLLARERRAFPGRAVSAEALLEEGWPDERMLPDAAVNRLRVALATLRKLGLKDLLVRTDDGYQLDPGVPVLLSSD